MATTFTMGRNSFVFGFSRNCPSRGWVLMIVLVISSCSVESVTAAQVCTTNSDGTTVCNDKLSGGAIAAIVITILLVLLLCAAIYYFIRRTRKLSTHAPTWVIPPLAFSSHGGRRRDVEEGDDSDDDKYLSVEKNQIQGPTWEARYDPSSAPLPGKGSSSWSSRLRSIKSGARSGSEYGSYGHAPASAPGHGSNQMRGSSTAVKKPRSAGAETSLKSSPMSKGKVHWGSLIHGSQSKNGSRSAGLDPRPEQLSAPVKAARSRPSPGLHIIAEGPGGFYNAPVIPPITPHTPRTPSRLGAAPPLSAGPGFSSAPIPPRTPRTAGATTPLTPRPVLAYSPVTPRGHMGAI
ncbi:hypothetical protein F5878DRAFT_620514 [Lentinula raphanica]|uniref:Uncharacterized protein n=1 Tax=Lentinula raphanica TaxID=153919 RepID=A0AA38P8M9_9AGAR|nr:hypothetical protein C8R42DRAFT_648850 [Lentinula raphanica]KAJ3826713.1 hypothetical protein F5880DRAFT_1610007 [Lentinula raphanica]KAJ3838071.1 hypothetical protein F5878DRAFT_620514 [Lentinula raphanica]